MKEGEGTSRDLPRESRCFPLHRGFEWRIGHQSL